MRYELKLGLVFLLSSKWQSIFITSAIAFGVAVQIFISSVVTSLQGYTIDKTLGSAPHIEITTGDSRDVYKFSEKSNVVYGNYIYDRDKIPNYEEIGNRIKGMPNVKYVSYAIDGNAIYKRGLRSSPLIIKGVDLKDADKIMKISPRVILGDNKFDAQSVLIGIRFSKLYSVDIGDYISLTFPNGKVERFRIRGIFDLSSRGANQFLVMMDLNRAQKLFDKVGYVNKIDIQVKDIFMADITGEQIKNQFKELRVLNWTMDGQDLLDSLRAQNTTNFIIQLVVILSTMMSTMSILLITVLRKSKEIGILKSMGAHNGEIATIFVVQGALYGLIGSLIGIVFAFFIIDLQKIVLGKEIFKIVVSNSKVIQTIIITTVSGVISSIAPAVKSSKLSPIEVIHGE
ncbi:MAG: ABC transporter permease [Fusobacteriaceae bacterium]|nr:ABC transporter permease [Fusobacteriaceae bacterium]MBP9510219.1 ABC transporter permease [Fusobacteriaceae bacterium]